ncbi:hypothetical protein [Jiangella muralis]|uniref:hypothetical protein n=1 Tax=Jiangella muralis TaxID=702383 RepID=UPI00069D201D|nr:hypothetical protein [Jiangella muralis]
MPRLRPHRLTALLTAMLGLALLHLGATPASAQPDSAASPQVAGCVGASFSKTLRNGEAICNGNYLVRMQGNGDLVLRVISTGRACWTSGTAGIWSNDAYAMFIQNPLGDRPYVDIFQVSKGRIGRILGAHTQYNHGTNANVNSKGEFWVGYRRVASC